MAIDEWGDGLPQFKSYLERLNHLEEMHPGCVDLDMNIKHILSPVKTLVANERSWEPTITMGINKRETSIGTSNGEVKTRYASFQECFGGGQIQRRALVFLAAAPAAFGGLRRRGGG
jgi:hypothetical protein